LASFEIKFYRRAARFILFGHRRNEEIMVELKVEPVDEKLRRYKSNMIRHVTRMNSSRVSKIMLNYRPNGRRPPGRPLKRLLDVA
jgi:hypothetical protein